jgi:hypothetical protein
MNKIQILWKLFQPSVIDSIISCSSSLVSAIISTCHFFVSNGLFNLLKFAKQNKRIYKWNPAYVCRIAAEMGNLKIIEWCITQKPFHWDYTICASAAFHGHLEIIKWIKANGFHWDSTACASAALNNQFETLEWLNKNGVLKKFVYLDEEILIALDGTEYFSSKKIIAVIS